MAVYSTEWVVNTVNRWLDSDPRVGKMVGAFAKYYRDSLIPDMQKDIEHSHVMVLAKLIICLKYSRYGALWNRVKKGIENKIIWPDLWLDLWDCYVPRDCYDDIMSRIRATQMLSIDKELSTSDN